MKQIPFDCWSEPVFYWAGFDGNLLENQEICKVFQWGFSNKKSQKKPYKFFGFLDKVSNPVQSRNDSDL